MGFCEPRCHQLHIEPSAAGLCSVVIVGDEGAAGAAALAVHSVSLGRKLRRGAAADRVSAARTAGRVAVAEDTELAGHGLAVARIDGQRVRRAGSGTAVDRTGADHTGSEANNNAAGRAAAGHAAADQTAGEPAVEKRVAAADTAAGLAVAGRIGRPGP